MTRRAATSDSGRGRRARSMNAARPARVTGSAAVVARASWNSASWRCSSASAAAVSCCVFRARSSSSSACRRACASASLDDVAAVSTVSASASSAFEAWYCSSSAASCCRSSTVVAADAWGGWGGTNVCTVRSPETARCSSMPSWKQRASALTVMRTLNRCEWVASLPALRTSCNALAVTSVSTPASSRALIRSTWRELSTRVEERRSSCSTSTSPNCRHLMSAALGSL